MVRRAARHRRGPTRRAAITHHSLKILHQQVGLACRAPATPDKGRAASGIRSIRARGAQPGWIYPTDQILGRASCAGKQRRARNSRPGAGERVGEESTT